MAISEAAGLGPEPAATAGRRELGRTAAGAGRPVPRGTVPQGVRGVSPVLPRSGAGGLRDWNSPGLKKGVLVTGTPYNIGLQSKPKLGII